MEKEVTKLKHLFRDWCGTLSIEEIMKNEPLISIIERVEDYFLRLPMETP